MARQSGKPSRADGDGQHHRHFAPTIHINSCNNAKIYVNTIINTGRWSSITSAGGFPKILLGNTLELNPGGENPGSQRRCEIDPRKGGRVDIYCVSKEGTSTSTSYSDSPIISVEIQKLSYEETSENKPMPAYVITVHKNNVSDKEAPINVSGKEAPISQDLIHAFEAQRRASDHIIKAENVILNSSEKINVGPGAGGENRGDLSASVNIIKK